MGLTIFIIKYLDFISAFNNKKISNDSSSNPKKKKNWFYFNHMKKKYYKKNINIKKITKTWRKNLYQIKKNEFAQFLAN
jgi:hypothetical protein